ncbi:MAG TPA: vitamin K epoxide reductase family protein [Pyrinomonadaceae bacterium]
MSTRRADAGEVGAHAEADGGDDDHAARRSQRLDALTAVLALVGLADAVYLTAEHLSGRSVVCMVTSGCDAVLQSQYASLPGGWPLASLGALAYFAVFSLATLSAFGYAHTSTLLRVVVAAMFAFTLWLLYVQAFVLEAFCSYCLLSAAVTTTLAALQVARLLLRPKNA